MPVFRYFALLALVSLCSAASSQGPSPDPYTKRQLTAYRAEKPIVLDGDLSDDVWKHAPQATQFVDRQRGTPMEDQTIAMLAYDDQYIYVAFDCRDSKPDEVMARETVRDSKYADLSTSNVNKEDNVTFSIDCFYSKQVQDQNVFSVNAIGTPSAQIAGGRGSKREWQGKWDSAAKRTPTGYTVEMRIPWAMLNYPSSSKPEPMAINFFRFQNRVKLQSIWSNVGIESFLELGGTWADVQPPKTAFRPKVSLLPYVLPGIDENNRFTFRSGVDARLPLTQQLTAVGSLNPDFNTIEGAVEGIQFSRAERFVPERRPFFLEGQSFFATNTQFNDIGTLFYARRIPTFDLGTKLYGKVSPSDTIGVLNTITFGQRDDFAARYMHDISPGNQIGGFISHLQGDGLPDNTVAQLDSHMRRGHYGLETEWMKSMGDGAGGGGAVLSGYYQDNVNVSVLQYHSLSSRLFVPDGFVPYTNYSGFFGFSNWSATWKKGPWRDYGLFVSGIDLDHLDGRPYQHGGQVDYVVSTKSDWLFELNETYQEVDGTIDNPHTVNVIYGATNRFRQLGLSYQIGRLASQPSHFVQPSASFRIGRKFDIAYTGALLDLGGQTRQDIIAANYEFSPTRSVGGRVVVQDRATNWYLSYKNAGRGGTDFYVIVGDPNALRFRRILQVKLVFAF